MGCFKLDVGMMMENCYIFFDENSGMAAIIDPGADAAYILDKLTEKNLTATHILLTHGHYDHTGAVEELRKATGAAVLACAGEEGLLTDPGKSYAAAGPLFADAFFHDNDTLNIGGKQLLVIHTPGHTAGSCCFYSKDENMLFSGDTLFKESIGRSDFATGDFDALISSIKNRLFVLPDDTRVCPGHMEESSIRHEKANNAFVR